MGETETPYFYDCGNFEPVTKPQNTRTPKTNQEKSLEHFKNMIFSNLKISETQDFASFEKTGTEK